MTAEIVNLRRARKAKARTQMVAKAAENRATHGRTRAEREHAAAERTRAERAWSASRREPDDSDV